MASPETGSLGTVRRVLRAGLVAFLLLPVAGVASVTGQTASPGPTPYDSPNLPHDARDLEALFPDSVDGRPLGKLSIGRPTIEGMVGTTSDLDAFADALGVELTDFEIAFANDPTAMATGTPVFNYMAFRVAGVTGGSLVEAYERLTPATEVDAVAARATIDGREVVWVRMPYNPVPNIWFWAEGDVLVGIQAADQATFEKLYRLMPARPPTGSPIATT